MIHPLYLIVLMLIEISGCIRDRAILDDDVLNQDALIEKFDGSLFIRPDFGNTDLEIEVDESVFEDEDMNQSSLLDLALSEEMECIPYDDQCPESQYCQYETERLQCVNNGEVPTELTGNHPECIQNRCSRGMMCLSPELVPNAFGEQSRCYQTCSLVFLNQVGAECSGELGCCTVGRHTCVPLEESSVGDTIGFGVCKY